MMKKWMRKWWKSWIEKPFASNIELKTKGKTAKRKDNEGFMDRSIRG